MSRVEIALLSTDTAISPGQRLPAAAPTAIILANCRESDHQGNCLRHRPLSIPSAISCRGIALNNNARITPYGPLQTLASQRRREDGKVLFGQNLIHTTKSGIGRVGDPVTVLA